MKRYLLDTNICLAYVRGNKLYQVVESQLNLTNPNTIVMISVVTKGELLALGKKNGWGKNKLTQLSQLLRNLVILDINESDAVLMDAYSDIDAFSQGKLPLSPKGGSAKNMGKNDLWIAAAAFASNAEVVTCDGDFDHLNLTWFPVNKF